MLKKLSKNLIRSSSKESMHSDVSLSFSDNIVRIGRATKTGTLHANEDRCTVLENLSDLVEEEVVSMSEMLEFDLKNSGDLLEKVLYAGVFDGHGGGGASSFAARNLHLKLAKNLEKIPDLFDVSAIAAVDQSFKETEREFAANAASPVDTSGSCAAVALIAGRDILLAHCGDCRVVVRSCGETIGVTKDHRAEDPAEIARITAMGGKVIEGRLMGVLCPSRVFGDFDVKATLPPDVLVATPDVARYSVDLGPVGKFNSFIVMATDGLWDVMEEPEVVKFVEKVLKRTGSAEVAAQRLVETASKNNHDDVTVVIVAWQRIKAQTEMRDARPQSKEEEEEDITSPKPSRKKYTPDAKSGVMKL